jgi:hypothetical protein
MHLPGRLGGEGEAAEGTEVAVAEADEALLQEPHGVFVEPEEGVVAAGDAYFLPEVGIDVLYFVEHGVQALGFAVLIYLIFMEDAFAEGLAGHAKIE